MRLKNVEICLGVVLPAAAIGLAAPSVAFAGCPELDHSHAALTRILAAHVTDGGVDYQALIRDDKTHLRAYLGTLEACEKADYDGWTREQQMAFLINAYNAYTLELITEKYPVRSIRSLTLIPGQVFKRKFIPLQVFGKSPVSLDDIEHGNLRPEFGDPRTHFAVNCASASCPELRNEAYVADRLDEQLDEMGRRFLADRNKNRLGKDGEVELSMIFKWFSKDFMKAGGAAKFAAKYASGDFKAALDGDPKISYLSYDWSLNDR